MPTRSKMDFKAALDADMVSKGVNERLLGKELNVTQQSISKWRHRGFPPLYRVQQLIDYFGPNSAIAKLDFQSLVTDVPRVRVQPPTNVRPGMPERARPAAEGRPEVLTAPAASQQQRDRFLTEQTVGFLRALPKGLHDAMLPQASKLPVGDALLHPDYLSDQVVMIHKTQHPSDPALATGKSQYLLELAGIKKAYPQLRCVLAVVYPGTDTARAISATRQALAEFLGVEVWVVPNGAVLARKLAEAEGVPFKGAPGGDESSDQEVDEG